MSTPLRNGSVFDDFSLMPISVGFFGSSIATSAKFKCVPASYAPSDGTVISPALKKPRKQEHV